MCYNCGCGNPGDDMGDVSNITNSTFSHLSEHLGKSLDETKSAVYNMLLTNRVEDSHVLEMFEKASKAWGQSIDEAKKNTLEMLKNELTK